MYTRFLIEARHCWEIDPQRISEAGGRLLGIGRLEDDGTVIVDVDAADDADSLCRLSALFSPLAADSHHLVPLRPRCDRTAR